MPPQLVQYGILGAAPPGVSVDLYTGVVTWTPDDQDASTNAYLVTIEGTDDGDPPLTSRHTYTIHVLGSDATLIVADLALVGDQVLISWRTTLGKTYSVQYTDSLASANWLPFTEFMSADSDSMSVADSRFNAQQRFYRVIQHD